MGFSAAVAMQEVIRRVKTTNALPFSFSLALPCACVFLKFSHDPFCCTPKISATPLAATTAGNLKKLIGLRQVQSGVFVVNLWNFSIYQSYSVQNHLDLFIIHRIAETPADAAPVAPAAYYMGPSEDGTRPGQFWANTYKPDTR